MTTRKTCMHPAGTLAFLLGQASTLWGTLVAAAYWLGFALLMPRHGAAAGFGLPLGPPLAGLALGALALALTRRGERHALPIAGVALNALALALAVALHLG
jgi:hypothetical protein